MSENQRRDVVAYSVRGWDSGMGCVVADVRMLYGYRKDSELDSISIIVASYTKHNAEYDVQWE